MPSILNIKMTIRIDVNLLYCLISNCLNAMAPHSAVLCEHFGFLITSCKCRKVITFLFVANKQGIKSPHERFTEQLMGYCF